MNSQSPLKRIMFMILTVVLGISLTLNVIRFTQPSLNNQGRVYPLFVELQYVFIHGPSVAFKTMIDDLTRLWALREENRLLRAQIERIAQYQAQIEESYRDVEALREFSELRLSMSEYSTLPATVIHRAPQAFLHTLSIDIGEADGVRVGDAVISSKGLIGKVNSVSDRVSVVLLLSTEQDINKITVRIQTSPVKTSEAILEKYNPNLQAFELKLLETDASITEGMKVISSGSGGFFPSGLLVGTVSSVENLSNALGLKILVSPAADFYHIDYVMVVKRTER